MTCTTTSYAANIMNQPHHIPHGHIDANGQKTYTNEEVLALVGKAFTLGMCSLPQDAHPMTILDNGTAQENSFATNAPLVITVDEMAKLLNICRPTAYELAKQDDFPSFMIGKRILVNRQGLQVWIDQQCNGSH